MSNKQEAGYVYILTNPSFREDWVKIGKTSRPVDVRSSELDNTAVPMPFEIYATIKTTKYNEVERVLHRTIDRLSDLRIRQNREFFNIDPAEALAIIKDIASIVDDAEVQRYVNNEPVDESAPAPVEAEPHAPRRGRFKFSLAGISIGETVIFDPTHLEVKVATDDSIEYEGRLYKLSPFVGTFLPEDQRNNSGAYQGPKFFSYKGQTLSDLRRAMEDASDEETGCIDDPEI